MATTQNYYKIKHGLEAPSQDAIQVTDNTGPTIRPSLLLDFAKTKTLDPRINFTRASTATYYDGKTVAKAEENLLRFSQQIGGTNWLLNTATPTLNNATAPDGTTTASLITLNSAGIFQTYQNTATLTGQITMSCYIKTGSITWIQFFYGGVNTEYANFNVSSGTLGNYSGTATITSVGNGWYRCTHTFTPSSNISSVVINTVDSGTTARAATNTASSGTWYLWGAQLEQRDRATAYTPTTATPITNQIPALQTAAANTARFDHNPITGESLGLEIEEQRTNLVSYSNNFDVSQWIKYSSSITANATIGPTGLLDAAKLTDTVSNADHYITSPVAAGGAATYTGSIYVKAAERTQFQVRLWGANAFQYVIATINLSTQALIGSITTFVATNGSYTLTPVGNGWFRVTLTGTFAAGITGVELWAMTANNGGAAYAGDGKSGLYVWGAQVEVGSFATSYIPTTLFYTGRASTGTYRASDNLIRTAPANTIRYNANESGGGNLLLEPAATNLLTYTDNFENAVWSRHGTSVAQNSDIAPDGSVSAARVIFSGAVNDRLDFSTAIVAVSGNTYTYSVWLKGSGTLNITVNTTSGLGGATENTIVLTNTWTRYTVSHTFTSAVTGNVRVHGVIIRDASTPTVWMWGAQLETGSVATSYIPSIETHTGRASTATYYDATGVIRTAASGQPRYTYNPALLPAPPKLLIEAQATNLDGGLSTYSNYASVTLNTNAALAPDGTNTAALLTNTSSSNPVWYKSPGLASNVYTYSAYFKAGNQSIATLRLDVPTAIQGTFNLQTQSVVSITAGATASIVNVGNGWYRCAITTNTTVTINNAVLISDFFSSSASIYIWGPQIETGYAASSYIPTSGSQVTRAADTSTSVAQTRAADVYSSAAVTRAADVASITGTNFSSWYTQGIATFFAEFTGLGNYPDGVGLSPGLGPALMAPNPGAGVVSDMFGTAVFAGTGNARTSNIKAARAFNLYALDSVIAQGGSVSSAQTNVTFPFVATGITVGARGDGTAVLNGTVKKVAYYPKRLSNAELINITS